MIRKSHIHSVCILHDFQGKKRLLNPMQWCPLWDAPTLVQRPPNPVLLPQEEAQVSTLHAKPSIPTSITNSSFSYWCTQPHNHHFNCSVLLFGLLQHTSTSVFNQGCSSCQQKGKPGLNCHKLLYHNLLDDVFLRVPIALPFKKVYF